MWRKFSPGPTDAGGKVFSSRSEIRRLFPSEVSSLVASRWGREWKKGRGKGAIHKAHTHGGSDGGGFYCMEEVQSWANGCRREGFQIGRASCRERV